MEIKSPLATSGCNAFELFDFLVDPRHLEEILPSDRVTEFSATETGCRFKASGSFDVVIERKDMERPRLIRFDSQKGTPIRFSLNVLIEEKGDERCEVQVVCDADLNPFMRMMAEKPLQEIFSGMVEKITERFPLG